MLPLAATEMERGQVTRRRARRGVTLVELLVAMFIAGLVASFVAGWISHTARQSAASQQRDDREQELSSLRNALFQDGIRGRTVEIGRSMWRLSRRGTDGEPDTVEWRIEPGTFSRGGSRMFAGDTILEGGIEPKASGLDPNWDLWSQLDRNFDGLVDPEHLGKLTMFDLRIVVRRKRTPARPPTTDTLRFTVPLLGPG